MGVRISWLMLARNEPLARLAASAAEVAGLAVTGLAMTLASPIAWTHYFGWFALPTLLLASGPVMAAAAASPAVPPARNAAAPAVVAAAASVAIT